MATEVPVPFESLPTPPVPQLNSAPQPAKTIDSSNSFAEMAKTTKTPSHEIILKVGTMPSSKSEVDALFTSHPKFDKLKPVLSHIKRLAFGKEHGEGDGADNFNRVFSRYLTYKNVFCCYKICHFFNMPQGCGNGAECGYDHICLFCNATEHGWSHCPQRQKLYDLISHLHFDIPSVQMRDSSFGVIDQLVDAYGSAKQDDKKEATLKLIKDMATVPKDKIVAQKQDYIGKKFFLPKYCTDEFVARMIISFTEKKFACINFNSHYCAQKPGKGPCPHKHICTHCGGDHPWVECEERLNQCLEINSLGIPQERLWGLIDDKRAAKK